MEHQLIRLIFFAVLVYLISSDLKDLLDLLSHTRTVGPYLKSPSQAQQATHKGFGTTGSSGPFSEDEEGSDSDNAGFFEDPSADVSVASRKEMVKKFKKNEAFKGFTEDEKEEILRLRSQMTQIMQDWCLPKLVCELHASLGERRLSNSLSEAEQGLLALIKETSMHPMGEVVSKYHFAAHMGQLLSNVEGNGCHNFYPNCPLSGTKVMQMVKKVRVK